MEIEDRFIKIKNLLQVLDDPLVVLDIGCRWGFQEHWKQLESFVALIGMDADEQEVQSLNDAHKKDEFIPKVLGAKNGYGNLYITQDPACSSLYSPDEELIRNRPNLNMTNLASTKLVEISTLDDWAEAKGISKVDFMKLDVQGAELDVLQGAEKTLQFVRMLEVEVQFNPLYVGVPLFGDVDRFLRQQGFSLWRIKNFSHYGLSGINQQSNIQEAVHFDDYTAQFDGRDGQLYWADAFYVRKQAAYTSTRSWVFALKDACIAKVLGFEDLSTQSLNDALMTCPANVAQKIREAILPPLSLGEGEMRRIKITTSCLDSESIQKVPQAGEVFDGPNGRYQLMHNGIKVIEDCYYGPWMTEIIRLLHGHHEPQEEKAFNEVIKYIPQNATMIELGSFWSYYSLWFHKQIVGANNYMIEPDPNNFEVGKRNFELNDMKGHFLNAAIGKTSTDSIPFQCESDNIIRQIQVISVDDFVAHNEIKSIELLLCDTQGAELEMLKGCVKSLEKGMIRFMMISTHHHRISNNPLTHQKCLNFMREHGAHILVEHNVVESYSGDGLIVASFRSSDRDLPKIEVSRNHPTNSLFRELEYDLDDMMVEKQQIKSELETVRAERDLALQQMKDFYHSRSYRFLTAPLRIIANFVRDMIKKS